MHDHTLLICVCGASLIAPAAVAQQGVPTTEGRPVHAESAQQHEGDAPPVEDPTLPEGMSLDEALDYAASPPPPHYPDPVPDDKLWSFTLIEQLEWRVSKDGKDQLGWQAQGRMGGDFNKFWWKTEGDAVFDDTDEGGTHTDLLYSRLVTPFWNLQFGAQYANEWESSDYDDRWSGVIALQGLAPGQFELDNSLYISEDGDITFESEAEYDVRITQRLVLQPRAEVGFAAQDVPERMLGAGITDADLDLRLRYEIRREIAPYAGLRYRVLTGETANIAESMGNDSEELFFVVGIRLAF